MPTLATDLINAHPGDVVVPLSDMLDLLGSRLDASELETLSQELILRRTSEVRAGDVISAELMNQILADVANLQTRLMVLESGIPSEGRPQIVLVTPNTGVMIGEQVQVSGVNLEPDQLSLVTMGGRTVSVFSSASHSKLLAFDVPPILGIPEDGAKVNLEITNEFGSDDIMVEVLRSQATELSVAITVGFQSIPTEVLLANTSYTITVRITALTSMSSEYILTPNIDNPAWSVAMAGGTDRITIPTSQPVPFEIDVDVLVTTGNSGSANISLRIEAVGHGDQNGVSSLLPLAIGDIAEVNTEITFHAPEIAVQNIDALTGNILLTPGSTVVFGVNAVFAVAGTYDLTALQISGDPRSLWTVQLLSPLSTIADSTGEIHQNVIQLQLDPGAVVSAPPAELSFTIARQGSTEPPAEFTRSLEVST